jgi:hypothetical protein
MEPLKENTEWQQSKPIPEDQWDMVSPDRELAAPELPSGSYSIQDQKLKEELEEQQAAAERKKKRVRERVRDLRLEFAGVLEKAAQLPKRAQLSQAQLYADPGYINVLNQEMDQKVVQVQEELKWDIEYHSKALTKLKQRFLDGMTARSRRSLASRRPPRSRRSGRLR